MVRTIVSPVPSRSIARIGGVVPERRRLEGSFDWVDCEATPNELYPVSTALMWGSAPAAVLLPPSWFAAEKNPKESWTDHACAVTR